MNADDVVHDSNERRPVIRTRRDGNNVQAKSLWRRFGFVMRSSEVIAHRFPSKKDESLGVGSKNAVFGVNARTGCGEEEGEKEGFYFHGEGV